VAAVGIGQWGPGSVQANHTELTQSWAELYQRQAIHQLSRLGVMNRNVDELIRLCKRATDAGVWTTREAMLHAARLDSLRAKLNADFRELMGSHERTNELLERASE
jgi:hypothetical protein